MQFYLRRIMLKPQLLQNEYTWCADNTYNRSINAILTSASILIIVTAIVGNFATAIAAAVCQAISLGTFCATLIILILLPALLATLDRFVVKQPSERIADAEKGIKKLLRGFKSLL